MPVPDRAEAERVIADQIIVQAKRIEHTTDAMMDRTLSAMLRLYDRRAAEGSYPRIGYFRRASHNMLVRLQKQKQKRNKRRREKRKAKHARGETD